MESLKKDIVASVEHIGRLQRMRVSHQTVWDKKEFIDNLMRTVVADEITALRMEYLTWNWFNR